MLAYRTRCDGGRRRGATFALVVVSIVMLLGMASLTIDVGMLYRARAEAQAAADAAALAGAWRLLDQDRLTGSGDMTEEIALARQTAVEFAARNAIINQGPAVDQNGGNAVDGDVVIGYLDDPTDPGETLAFGDPTAFNTVQVRVRRDSGRNGPVPLFFAGILGIPSAEVTAEAYATFKDGVIGYRATGDTGDAGVLPFALQRDAWAALLAGTVTSGDDYAYDEETGEVSAGSDGILELNVFPGGAAGQLPPGNFGTVDIGDPNNSAANLARQIVSGLSEDDLAFLGGELALGPDGTLLLNGDTGVSAGAKDQLASIIGLPRALPLFSTVTGTGGNSVYTITGFTGIRILSVKLTGSMPEKRVVVQPAFVVDAAAITGPGSGSSYFVYRPVELVR